MLVIGASSFPVAVNVQALASAQAFHSRTDTGYLPMAKRFSVTRWIGFSVLSSLLPMAKVPPGSVIISGSLTGLAAAGGVAGCVSGTVAGVGCGAAGAIGGAVCDSAGLGSVGDVSIAAV